MSKFIMNRSTYIIRREICRWFRIWSQKLISTFSFKRKSCLTNFYFFEFLIKFQSEIYPYVIELQITFLGFDHFWCTSGIQINILISNILQQYIDIADININIGFSKIAISISILKNCWQYIANILIEQYIANLLVDEKIF